MDLPNFLVSIHMNMLVHSFTRPPLTGGGRDKVMASSSLPPSPGPAEKRQSDLYMYTYLARKAEGGLQSRAMK